MPEFVNPNEILDNINLRPNMTAADLGSGSGGWAIPLAKKLEEGRVFAVDIQESPLSALEGKAKIAGVSNIVKVIANVEESVSQLKGFSCDLVLITDLLYQVDNKENVFGEARRVLKSGGTSLVVEWSQNSPLGPKEGKVSKEEVQEIAKNSGLRFEKELMAGDYHFALVFKKP